MADYKGNADKHGQNGRRRGPPGFSAFVLGPRNSMAVSTPVGAWAALRIKKAPFRINKPACLVG